ncbi:hypothetical protein MP638_000938 [Amoeboaphelidium occidentale]|nr:hypothetical protein MP638_000938 [Amoeboaphelidium occidentale]
MFYFIVALALALPAVMAGFSVNDRSLMYNGRQFFVRGINLQYGDNPDQAMQAFDPIAQTGANMIRLQLRSFTEAWRLEKALRKCSDMGMKVMLMYWDEGSTCTNNRDEFYEAVNYWLRSDILRLINDYREILLLNIVNEFTNGYHRNGGIVLTMHEFKDIYIDGIKRLRSAGVVVPLVVDAYHCGQQLDFFLKIGRDIINADPQKDVLLSMHLYHKWENVEYLKKGLNDLANSGLPFIIGEYGQVDLNYLHQFTFEKKIGTIAWSWYGNGNHDKHLDMNNGYAPVSLTAYGNEVVNGNFGIRKTSY